MSTNLRILYYNFLLSVFSTSQRGTYTTLIYQTFANPNARVFVYKRTSTSMFIHPFIQVATIHPWGAATRGERRLQREENSISPLCCCWYCCCCCGCCCSCRPSSRVSKGPQQSQQPCFEYGPHPSSLALQLPPASPCTSCRGTCGAAITFLLMRSFVFRLPFPQLDLPMFSVGLCTVASDWESILLEQELHGPRAGASVVRFLEPGLCGQWVTGLVQ